MFKCAKSPRVKRYSKPVNHFDCPRNDVLTPLQLPSHVKRKTKTKLEILRSVAILAALLATTHLTQAQSIWIGTNNVAANTNWSTAANLSPSGAPVASTQVRFNDSAAESVAGTINNVVDTSGAIASLTYGNTNGFHTTLIAPGVTLTNSGNLTVGTETDNGGVVLIGTATITG